MTREPESPDPDTDTDSSDDDLAARISGLLRDTPVEIDPDRRERAVRAALASVGGNRRENGSLPSTGRHTGATRVLAVAAAVLVVVAGAGVVGSQLGGGSGRSNSADVATAAKSSTDSESSVSGSPSAGATTPAASNEEARPSAPAQSSDEPDGDAKSQASSDEGRGAAPEAGAGVVNLGAFPDRASLISRVESVELESVAGIGESDRAFAACRDVIHDLGADIIAYATVGDSEVVVGRTDSTSGAVRFVVLDAATCAVID